MTVSQHNIIAIMLDDGDDGACMIAKGDVCGGVSCAACLWSYGW